MKFSTAASTLLLAATAIAQDVACVVNGVQVATVDLQTGTCPFTIPSNLPVFFNFEASDDYNVEFYYAIASNTRYFNDIVDAGNTIEIPASLLYGTSGAPLYQVHVEESPASNSTAAIRKRLLGATYVKRDAASDFAEAIKSIDGTLVSSGAFEVVDLASVSSGSSAPTAPVSSGVETIPAATGTGVLTVTNDETTIITITSCSDNKCSATAVPATQGLTTVTVGEEVTSYTTWCPLSGAATETDVSTTVITITSCSDNKCSATAVSATEGLTTVTIGEEVTSYTTWCPVTAAESTGAATGATTAAATTAAATTAAGTTAAAGSTSAGASTVAAESTAAASTVSTYEGAANKVAASLVVLALPLAYLF